VTKSWTTRRCGRMPTVSATLEALGSAVVHAKFIKWTVEDDRDRNTNALTPSQARNWIDTKSALDAKSPQEEWTRMHQQQPTQ
jgi:N-formylglutamate amidohydrolase